MGSINYVEAILRKIVWGLMVDQPAQMFVKHVKDIKNAAERSEIVRFYL